MFSNRRGTKPTFTPLVPPDELDLREEGGTRRVVADSDLQPDATWGPYPGTIRSEAGASGEEESEVGGTSTDKAGVRGQS